jgi:hypothetical protein
MYFAYLHSYLKKKGMLLWGNTINPRKNVYYKKRAIRLMVNTTSCKPYFKKLKNMKVQCTYTYDMFLYTKMYLSRFKTNSMFHTYNTRNKIYLFQVITPNYLKRVPHTTVCLFITNILMKLQVLHEIQENDY